VQSIEKQGLRYLECKYGEVEILFAIVVVINSAELVQNSNCSAFVPHCAAASTKGGTPDGAAASSTGF
jgi:hypothetical protein